MTIQIEEELNMKACLEKCLEISYNHVKVASGSKEILKTLVREQELKLVILAKDLIQGYQDVILNQCKAQNVPVVYLESRKELAEIFPYAKLKKAGAVGIKDFVRETDEMKFVLNAIK